eukprot:921990-Prorocentrum_minimum.AAC.1
MPPPLTRWVCAAGMCPLPSRDWRALLEYAPSPHVIVVRAAGIWPAGSAAGQKSPHPREAGWDGVHNLRERTNTPTASGGGES